MVGPALGFIAVIFPLVVIHELGHLLIGKILGAQPRTFSIGFGRPIFKWKKWGILWKLGWIPLGGYVSFRKGQFQFEKRISGVIAPCRWFFIALAGPAMNILVSSFLIFLLFFSVFSRVSQGKHGENEYIRVESRTQFLDSIYGLEEPGYVFQLNSDGKTYKVAREPHGILFEKMSFSEKTRRAVRTSYKVHRYMTIETTRVLQRLFRFKSAYKDIAGPVGIAGIIYSYGERGMDYLLYIVASISFALGYFNLLPLVFLDGGRAGIALIQCVTGKQITQTLFNFLSIIGIIIIFFLLIVGTYGDIIRLLGLQ